MFLTINITPPAEPPVSSDYGALAYNFHDMADFDPAMPLINWALTGRWVDGVSTGTSLTSRDATTNLPDTMPANGMRILWDFSSFPHSPTGQPRHNARHVVRHNLPGTYSFAFGGGLTLVSSSAGRIEFDCAGNSLHQITITGPTGAMPSGWTMEVLRLSDETAFDNTGVGKSHATRVFIPEYLALWQSKKPANIRFMKGIHTERGLLENYADRCTEDDLSLTAKISGINGSRDLNLPIEYAVGLCNYLQCDLWWTSQMKLTTAAETSFATYVRNNLDIGLRCYWEYNNEVWNFGYFSLRLCGATWNTLKTPAGTGTVSCTKGSTTFTSTADLTSVITSSAFRLTVGSFTYDIDHTSVSWNGSQTTMTTLFGMQAQETVSGGAYRVTNQINQNQGQAIEAVRHAKPWNDVFTAGGQRSRLKIVYGSQLANTAIFTNALNADWSEEPDYQSVASTHDVVTINPYFGSGFLNDSAFADLLRANHLASPGSSGPDILQYATGTHPTLTASTPLQTIKGWMKSYRTIADAQGMDLIPYEAGSHVVHAGPVLNDAYWTDVRDEYFACMTSPEFITLFQEWASLQIPYCDFVMQFKFFELWTRFGNWGETPYYGYPGDSRVTVLDSIRSKKNLASASNPPVAALGTQTVNLSAGVSASVDLNDYFSINTTGFTAASLPSGLSLNPSTGVITGTPSAGTSTHTINGTNGVGGDTLSMRFVVA